MLKSSLMTVAVFAAAQSFAAPPRPTIEVARMDPKTHRIAPFNRSHINTRLPDGSPVKEVKIEQVGGTRYLVLRGGTPTHCKTTRVKLVRMASGRFGVPGNNASISSCSGNPCSSCGFTKDGLGCFCKDNKAGHICNHTITSGLKYHAIIY